MQQRRRPTRAVIVVRRSTSCCWRLDRTASALDVVADVVGAVLGFAAMRAAAGGSRLARAASWALAVVTLGVLGVLLAGLVVSGS